MSDSEKRMRAAMVELISATNAMGNEKEIQEAVRNVFHSAHRTLQQSTMRMVIVPVLQELSSNHLEHFYDLRNEASCTLAFKMLIRLSEEDLYLPFV